MNKKYFLTAVGLFLGICLVFFIGNGTIGNGTLLNALADYHLPEVWPFNWRDEFDDPGGNLDSRWFWISEGGTWSISLGSLDMQASTPPRILVQDAPDTDYTIGTKMSFYPDLNFQFAGLTLRGENPGELLAFGRAYCDSSMPNCVGEGIYFDHVDGDLETDNFATTVPYTGTTYLKVQRVANDFYGYASPDGVSWTLIGTQSVAFNVVSIGLLASDGFQNTEARIAKFDFFEIYVPAFEAFLPAVLK